LKSPVKLQFSLWIILVVSNLLVAQTTGKISGTVTDAETGEPLPGANVVVEGELIGAATDNNGRFHVINVRPGEYTVIVNVIAYKPIHVENVRVSVNRTFSLDVKMTPTVLEGETVTVTADRISFKRDQTSTIKNVSSDQIKELAIESMSAVVNMQAGVVAGHFRGGRSTEVTYMIDGIQVDEAFSGEYTAVEVEPEAVQDLEIITGTFNAEYGRAMSGIVNIITKDGGNNFEGSLSSGYGNYYTRNENIFIGLTPSEFNRNKDYKVQLSGPILKNRITFLTNIRFQDNKNHLNGIHRFNVTDESNYYSSNPSDWIDDYSGDSSFVAMNRSNNQSLLGKLTFTLGSFRLSTLYSLNEDEWHGYDHIFKYNPYGMAATHRRTEFAALSINHMLSRSLFYELKLSYMDNYSGWYLYEDPLDSNYVHDRYMDSYGPGFFTGGQQKGHSVRIMEDWGAKFDLTWQVNHTHSLKWGAQYIQHQLDNQWHEIRNKYIGTVDENILYEPDTLADNTLYADVYKVEPIDASAYIQDKMEFDEMVINFGIRYDYFDPNTVYPSDRRNPANQLSLPDSMMSVYPMAEPFYQVSPRFGLAYQLGDVAVLHFSYGHFFQLPPLYALYQGHSFLISPNDYVTTIGNSRLKPEKTVTYEIGLWQALTRNIGLEVTLFYKDIYNLLSTKIISTYNQIEYGLFSNKDYGNVRGLEVKFDYGSQSLNVNINYTLQYTRGNADSPQQSFDRAGDSMDPVNRFIPMSWDQRHTFNATVGYHSGNFHMSATGYYNSGTPYTFSPLGESVLSRINLYPNNDYQPSKYQADLTARYSLQLANMAGVNFFLTIYNLFDRLNEEWVNSQTGRAYTDVEENSEILLHRSNFNDYEDVYQNPSMYSTPRMIKFGLELTF
jgi:outer membrane receptor protein involved in Fe transport